VQAAKENEKPVLLPWAHLRLPPFPRVAVRVLQLASNENVQLHQLSELISSDPAFASEVLTIANSLLYAPRYPAGSILQAIAVMGANTLQGVCITVGVRSYMGRSMNQPAMKVLWRHNLASAIVAQRLASGGFIDKEAAYTCGVLHDIGRVALAVVRMKEYAHLLETHKGSASSILEKERELGFPAFAGCESVDYKGLLAELPDRERRLFYPELERLAFEVAAGIRAVESV